jgi:hypothetical protein
MKLGVCILVGVGWDSHLLGCISSVKKFNGLEICLMVDVVVADKLFSSSLYDALGIRELEVVSFDSFSDVRNKGVGLLELGGCGWCLMLDMDERVSVGSWDILENSLEKLDKNVGGLMVNIISPHWHLGGVKIDRTKLCRLFRLGCGYSYSGRVHEQISGSILLAGNIVLPSDVLLHHLGYDIEGEEMRKKVYRNLEFMCADVVEGGITRSAIVHFGKTAPFLYQFWKELENVR